MLFAHRSFRQTHTKKAHGISIKKQQQQNDPSIRWNALDNIGAGNANAWARARQPAVTMCFMKRGGHHMLCMRYSYRKYACEQHMLASSVYVHIMNETKYKLTNSVPLAI